MDYHQRFFGSSPGTPGVPGSPSRNESSTSNNSRTDLGKPSKHVKGGRDPLLCSEIFEKGLSPRKGQKKGSAASPVEDANATQLAPESFEPLSPVRDPHDAVLKVFAVESEYNYGVPWSTYPQTSVCGSAFACTWEGRQVLLTSAHVVRDAALVELRKRGDHAKHVATVLCLGVECDLALLDVGPAFRDCLEEVQFAESLPSLGDVVTCVGYPTGGDNLSITQGVISRIDMQAYPTSARTLLVVQIDAAINPGNSGGPVLDSSGRCAGIAFQALSNSENVGYIVPAREVIDHFLKDFYANGRYTGFGDLGFSLASLENKHMRHKLGLTPDGDGAMIRLIHAATPAAKALRRGDVLCSIDGQAVGQDGKVAFLDKSRISVDFVSARKFPGDFCELEIVRAPGELLQVTLELSFMEWLISMDPPKPPEYFIIGGLVFTVLSEPFLRHRFGSDFGIGASARQVALWATYARRDFQDHQIVVLTQVLADELTQGFTNLSNTLVEVCNGQKVRNLRHLITLVEESTEEWLQFQVEDEQDIILPKACAEAATPGILLRNAIAHDRSVQHRSSSTQVES